MGDWYWIGAFAGFGVAIGVTLAGLLGPVRSAALAVVAGSAATAGGIALAFSQWDEALGAVAGGALGGLGAVQLVRGVLRRGGTHAGTAILVGGIALLLGAAALIPIVGYLEAAALPLVALRARRRSPERYAGLRTLARD